MSLYCFGFFCTKKNDCLRFKTFNDLIAKHPEIKGMNLLDCADLGIWFVRQIDCITHGHEDGVFPEKGGEK